ncbi:hypothetical protein ACSTG9_23650, partial [Vibrio parahaemolyticus]
SVSLAQLVVPFTAELAGVTEQRVVRRSLVTLLTDKLLHGALVDAFEREIYASPNLSSLARSAAWVRAHDRFHPGEDWSEAKEWLANAWHH